ncbi:metallophosphoesterase [Psychrobacter sp. I-STPA10]|uniref:metallophosphoesterase n=1 Tax=Psychrobacter sp. I-STPA10 TaxID=2585769 RepID=UPI001E325704|nr:metallophosphoesterase [Psychrobacter sp. I-STPA10]
MIYDVIGDVHGHADKLIGLLKKLGYTLKTNHSNNQTYYAPPDGHRAIFIGDLIDRGTSEVATLQIVFAMLDAGVADAVMGNHEYNALAYATVNNCATETKTYLRVHNQTHTRQHEAFLAEIPFGSEAHQYWLNRFYELPLWIETEHACFVHACWHVDKMAQLESLLTADHCLTPKALQLTSQKGTPEYDALERILKGVEMPLPDGVSFTDKDGAVRRNMRVQWWLDNLQGKRIIDIARAPTQDLAQIPADIIASDIDFMLKTDKPVFVGHYWLTGTPMPLSPQVVCTDYSAAGKGFLTAYQFDTTNPLPLTAANFVQYRPTDQS